VGGEVEAAEAGEAGLGRELAQLLLAWRPCMPSPQRWEDVDFATGEPRVRVALQRVKGEPRRLVEPKTRQSRRTIAMPKAIAARLRAHRTRQVEEQLLAGPR
jgi:hypothetical protein